MLHRQGMAALPACLLAASVLVWFHDKPHTVDDALFLWQARHVLVEPWHPTAFVDTWSEGKPSMSAVSASGPIGAYVLVPTVLVGGREWVARLTTFVFLAWAAASFAALTRRLDPSLDPRVAALLLVATPALLAMATTSMPDVPALALGLAGLERVLAYRDEPRFSRGGAAAVLLALGSLTRTHAAVLILEAAALLWIGRSAEPGRPTRTPSCWRALWPPIASTILVMAAAWATRDPQGDVISLWTAAKWFSSWRHVPGNILALFAHLVLAVPFALPWLLARRRRAPWWTVASATLLAAVLLWHLGQRQWWWVAPMVGLGAGAVADVMHWGLARRDGLQLALALWLVAAFPLVVYVHLPSKYLVLSAPAAVLLVLRAAQQLTPCGRRGLISATMAAGVLLGVLIIRADCAFAELGRVSARRLVAPYAARGQRVWFAGKWSSRWYAEAAGALSAAAGRPAPGDLLVTERFGRSFCAPGRCLLLDTVSDSTPGGRVMSSSAGAGFYSNSFGYLPWSWGREEINRFELWQVVAPLP